MPLRAPTSEMATGVEEKAKAAARERQASASDTARSVFGFVLALALLVGLFFLMKGLFPADLPQPDDPDFVDAIFSNRAVIWAARVLLVAAAVVLAVGGVFIVASIVFRMKTGDWLKRAGPFEVSEVEVAELKDQIELWRRTAVDGQREMVETQELLEESDELIKRLHLQAGLG
jgi:hypothetical protein